MASGRVKWFNPDLGYGFIERENGEPDLFLHWSALPDSARDPAAGGNKNAAEGAAVEFEVAQGRKGPEARDVTVTP